MNMIKPLTLAIAACTLSFSAVSSFAAPILHINDNEGTSFYVTDQGPQDNLSLEGGVSFVGSVGDWIVSSQTGISKPILGTNSAPELDLVSLNISSSNSPLDADPAVLTLTFFDDGFLSPDGLLQFMSNIGGTTDGSISWSTCIYDSGQNPLEECETISSGSFEALSASDTPFAFSNSGVYDPSYLSGNEYGIALTAEVMHGSGTRNTSFDYSVKVPEPSSLYLSALGLLALFARRKGTEA